MKPDIFGSGAAAEGDTAVCFTYWDNRAVPQKKLFEITLGARLVLDADKALEKATGFNPVKCPWIGLTVEKIAA